MALEDRKAASGNRQVAKQTRQEKAPLPDLGIQFNPSDTDTLYKLGLYAQTLNQPENAAPYLEEACSQDPANAAYRNSLANLYLNTRQWGKAETHLKAGLSLAPEHKELLSNMGLLQKTRGKYAEAGAYFEKALAVDPDFLHARENLDFLYKDVVASWHFSMMNDRVRNDAYNRAIRKAVGPQSLVFEIGTGAGLLAMMAARAGAKHVITTELVPHIAETAREIVAQNGFGSQITVLCKSSQNCRVGEDLPEKADVLITETFDAGFLGEDAVPSIQHARQHLLKPGGKILPRAGTVYGALLESRKLWEECAVDSAAGFDLRAFNRFRENISGKYVQNFPHRRLSEDFEIFHFEFSGDPIQAERKAIEVEVQEAGAVHMLIYWFRLYLDEEVVINTNIEDESCWRIAAQILDPPLQVTRGQKVPLILQHDRQWLKLRLDQENYR